MSDALCRVKGMSCDLLCRVVGAWCRGEMPDWQIADDEEWESLVEQSRAQGVSGLLYRLLPDSAPAEVRARLQSDYNTQLAGNMLYLHQLAQIVPALQSAGVRFAVVKGAALLATVYTAPGTRAMKDIDLLVHPEDANVLKSVMAHLGWQEEDEDIAGKQFGERYRA
ncbi:MAG: nucleotidyltransferase family protein, partial [Armatimonadota bacterium]